MLSKSVSEDLKYDSAQDPIEVKETFPIHFLMENYRLGAYLDWLTSELKTINYNQWFPELNYHLKNYLKIRHDSYIAHFTALRALKDGLERAFPEHYDFFQKNVSYWEHINLIKEKYLQSEILRRNYYLHQQDFSTK